MKRGDVSAFRQRLGLSRPRLAKLLELPNPETSGQVTVARWESGARPLPSILAAALEGVEMRVAREQAQKS